MDRFWLEHNPLYIEQNIDHVLLNDMPADGLVFKILPVHDSSNNGDSNNESYFPNLKYIHYAIF